MKTHTIAKSEKFKEFIKSIEARSLVNLELEIEELDFEKLNYKYAFASIVEHMNKIYLKRLTSQPNIELKEKIRSNYLKRLDWFAEFRTEIGEFVNNELAIWGKLNS